MNTFCLTTIPKTPKMQAMPKTQREKVHQVRESSRSMSRKQLKYDTGHPRRLQQNFWRSSLFATTKCRNSAASTSS
jgi:hypothetical protein